MEIKYRKKALVKTMMRVDQMCSSLCEQLGECVLQSFTRSSGLLLTV